MLPLRLAILFFVLVAATPSHAARCGGDFNTFIASVSADAQGAGISPSVVSSALSGVSEDAAGFYFDPRPRATLHKTLSPYFLPPLSTPPSHSAPRRPHT